MRSLITAFLALTLIATFAWSDDAASGFQHRLDTLGEDAREVGSAVRDRLGELGEDAQELGQGIAGAVSDTVDRISPEESDTEASAEQEAATESASTEPPAEEEPAGPEGKELALTVLNSLRDHVTATMTGGYSGRLISEEEIEGEMLRKDLSVYFRMSPRAVRIEFHSPDDGQVVIWQEGWEDMLVDRPWLPQLSIDPSGERALATSHRPVPTFGIDLTLDRYVAAIEQAPSNDDVTCVEGGREMRGRQELIRYDFTHPAVPGSPVTDFTVWLDPETAIPIHFENRTADGSVYERYRYIEFDLNPSMAGSLFEE